MLPSLLVASAAAMPGGAEASPHAARNGPLTTRHDTALHHGICRVALRVLNEAPESLPGMTLSCHGLSMDRES